jgi:hypothetical protein
VIERQLTGLEKPLTGIGAIATIGLCVAVASHHGLKFGKGLGGYFLGNILAALLVLPLSLGIEAASSAYGFPWGSSSTLLSLPDISSPAPSPSSPDAATTRAAREQLDLMEVF